ncbi:DNA repair protein RAD50 [Kwoniella mangroviensis CBS 10435]|uniref:DNA repair protein RAD50 n=1 Tax=Kwoniella mangroviensis CBS 10435 TaxID=1331196 RepID=A0A1B9IMN0_9TREE|nr:DNA repair protein RAD50 [Kwoniella mangroviensis CBS 10435]
MTQSLVFPLSSSIPSPRQTKSLSLQEFIPEHSSSTLIPSFAGQLPSTNMASLNKLAIRGIRSFDDKHVQVIEFYSPLTVIVGHNGSGKTTIIECLKYATTGDMPPNTKGGAFVHDPKMANEKEVKAQVRLRFWNVNRQRMTATRNLQVTTKKTGALTMKTLEGILAKTDPDGGEGKRNTISTKCSEMDEEVPLLLGVSKSILENVIFCHQEESNWPLSEPAALKKKFDDIFEATKYTKALDNIKALRKERTAELKVDKERLKFLKSDKDKAERMRKDLQDAINQENSKQTQLENLKEQLERVKGRNADFYNEAREFREIFERSESLKDKKKMYEENRQHALSTMNVMNESTEELQHMLNNFDAHLRSIESKRATQQSLKDKEEGILEDLRNKERSLASKQGGLLANRRMYEKNLREREAVIREVAKTHDFPGYDYSPLEDHKIMEFVEKMHELVRKAENDLKKLQAENSRKERELQAELDKLSNSKASALATKRSKQEQIAKLNDKIRSSEASFDSITSLDAEISILQGKLTENEEQKSRLETEIRESRYDEQIREKAMLVRQKEAERDKINAELSALNRQADSRAQLTIKRNEVGGKTAQVDSSIATHATRFKELVGTDVDAETMEDKIALASGRKDRELQDAEAASAAVNRNVSQLQTSLNIAKQTLKTKKDELSRLEKSVRDGLAAAETEKATVDEAVEEAMEEVDYRRNQIANAQQNKALWEKFAQVAKTKHKCYGCDREILHDQERVINRYVQTRIDSYSPEGLKEYKEEEEQWNGVLQSLRKLQPSVAQCAELRENVIPSLEKQVQEEAEASEKAQEEVEEAKTKVQKAKLATRDLQNLKSAAALVSRTITELKELKSDISRLERDLEGTGSLKTVEEVQREVDQVSNEIKTLSRDQQSLSAEKELKTNALRSAADDISRKTLKMGELRSQQERRMREEQALKEMREGLEGLQAELKDLDAAAQNAEAPWRQKNEALNRYRAERQNSENDASLQVGLYQSSMSEVEGKHRACQAYIAEGNDRQIREVEASLSDIKREISVAQDARTTIESTIASLSSELSKAESLKGNISNNLKYRDDGKRVAEVQKELDGLDLESAAKSRKEFSEKYRDMMDEEEEVGGKVHLYSGQLLAMTENRKKTEKTLKSDYKDIDKQFKDQLIKTKVSEHANNDLEKYGKALDNAILKYHSIKMDEINDTIGHLWNKTYQGTDIDGIRIVSDHDETTSTSTRKSYNYRVVMVKNDVELDMRGRCSAGQKVLASIIIRLALAESFGQGCGVLALDEPTTNLDQENINALAEALAEIIRERRKQANFQLIVITHDEGFLQRLAAYDVVDFYWRVSRDASQKSILERQRVA